MWLLPRRGPPGPSPRVRGAEGRPGSSGPDAGTIPAGAGSRTARTHGANPERDHPRECGEQRRGLRGSYSYSGPSPRVRGAEQLGIEPHDEIGTIPAGAGSSWTASSSPARRGDHPRGCGEQVFILDTANYREGPSPRVRGAVSHPRGIEDLVGTIPAGAGSRSRSRSGLGAPRDHPRGCGEQRMRACGFCQESGPSPRVRGAAARPGAAPRLTGTIPAGAGSSRCGRTAGCTWRGPSPRVRGAGDQVRDPEHG